MKNLKNKRMVSSTLSLVLLVSGCSSTDTEVQIDRNYRTGFVIGQNFSKGSGANKGGNEVCGQARDNGWVTYFGTPQQIMDSKVIKTLETENGYQGCLDGFDDPYGEIP